MNKIDTNISRNAKDIIQKYTSGLFKDTTLEFYGIKTAKIKELINVELPVVEVGETSTDFIFLLEDNTYLHFEFQTTYNKSDIVRFATYDIRLYERDKRSITTVIIYTADVKEANTNLSIGSLSYNPNKIMMYDYDGNTIFNELQDKILNNQELKDIDILNLILLPLMRNTIPKEELAIKSIKLANTISDRNKRDTCIGSIFAFTSKYLSDKSINKVLEVLRMTDIAIKFIEEGIEKGKQEEKEELAKNALLKGLSIDVVAEITKLDIDKVKKIQEEINNG